jgi:colanic acid biosynthesis protein WcaH
MPERVEWVSDDDWEAIVSNAPIVSVDLIVLTPDGVVLGRRENEPAKGLWFVPGGRVQKGERLAEAAQRVARDELGVEVDVRERLGVYEHLYEEADVADAGGKHYVPVGFVVETDRTAFETDDQHGALRVFPTDDLPDLHEYVEEYLRDAGVFSR